MSFVKRVQLMRLRQLNIFLKYTIFVYKCLNEWIHFCYCKIRLRCIAV